MGGLKALWGTLGVLVLGCGSAGPHPQTQVRTSTTAAPSQRSPAAPKTEAHAVASAEPRAAAPSEPATDPEPQFVDRFSQVPGLVRLYQTDAPSDLDERCGDFEVRTRLVNDQTEVELVNAAGKILKRFKPKPGLERFEPAWCFDVTGDGVPELAVTKTTGGAHCCHENTLISLTPKPTTLVVYAQGNGSNDLLTPVDVDGDGVWELVDSNDVLVGEGSEAYAFTRFLPAIFRLENGKYVAATKHFPGYLKNERTRATEELKACAPSCWDGGEGEYVMALSLLIGDWDAFSAAEGCPAAAKRHLDKLGKRIAKRLH